MSKVKFAITCILFGYIEVCSTCPLGCDAGWDFYNGKCFLVSQELTNWANAQEKCISLGSILGEPRTTDVLDFFNNVAASFQKKFWVGGSDLEKEGSFVWSSSGLPINDDRFWSVGEPNGGILENCLLIKIEGYGNDAKCEKNLGCICEKEPNQNIYSNIDVEEGNNAILKCPVTETGSNTPDILWVKGTGDTAEPLTEKKNRVTMVSSDLVLESVLWTDSGIYTCSYASVVTRRTYCFNITINAQGGMCLCDCYFKDRVNFWANQIIPNRTYEELVEYLQPILQRQRKELLVDKRNLTSAKRRRSSAPDSRVSSATMGYVAVFFFCATVGFIISADVVKFVKYFLNEIL